MIEVWILSFFSVAMMTLAVVLAAGKGDKLIAGYNTATPKEREQVNIRRLRGVIAGILVYFTIVSWLPVIISPADEVGAVVLEVVLIFVGSMVGILLASTWCIKKAVHK